MGDRSIRRGSLPPEAPIPTMLSSWRSQPAPKVPELAGRTVPLATTEARLAPLVPGSRITRVSDLTPLDPLGLPVFCAVTPLAEDLCSHLGKGATPRAARVSALVEAVERLSAQWPATGLRRARAAELERAGDRWIDPVDYCLPDDSAWDPQEAWSWTRGTELRTGATGWLPADLVHSPPREGVLRGVDTNGLASGNTHLEAVIHALYEVIERDAVSQAQFVADHGSPHTPAPALRGIDLRSLPDQARTWVRRAADQGLDFAVHQVPSDLGVPVFAADLSDPAYPGPDGPIWLRFSGFGAELDPSAAVLRAITEAVQARLGWVLGARDSFNSPVAAVGDLARSRRLWPAVPSLLEPFTVGAPTHRDLRDELDALLQHLLRVGIDAVWAFDLTDPELGLPTVRVRVPQLAVYQVNRRRLGARCLRHLL